MVENFNQQPRELQVYSVSDDLDRIEKQVNKRIFSRQFDSRFERLSNAEQEFYAIVLYDKKVSRYMAELTQAMNSGVAKATNTARTLKNIKYVMQYGIPAKDLV